MPITRRAPVTLTMGTLSFAKCGAAMMLGPSERVRLILAAVEAYEPDLLVTAGYAVHSRKQLPRLAEALREDEPDTLVVTEVHHDGRPQRSPGQSHAMWAVYGDGDLHRFGRQAFARSREVKADDERRLTKLRGKLAHRSIPLGDLSVFGLCCGELNIVQGRTTPRFVDPEVGAAILAADIVINPTHDRMGNAGMLAAKRRFLSQPGPDGRARAYVSCSNWEACGLNGRVQRPSPTLHTVYVAGQPLDYEELADGAFGFVYRQWQLSL